MFRISAVHSITFEPREIGEVGRTGSGWCQMAGSGIGGVKPSNTATTNDDSLTFRRSTNRNPKPPFTVPL